MRQWQQHKEAALGDLMAAGMANATVDQILGHLHDAAANINRAIEEVEGESETEDDRDD